MNLKVNPLGVPNITRVGTLHGRDHVTNFLTNTRNGKARWNHGKSARFQAGFLGLNVRGFVL